MTLQAGSRLGPYEILSAVMVTGAGEVYRGLDHEHARDVSIRALRIDAAAHPALLERFERDMRAAAALTHPDILDIYDVRADAHAAYVVSAPLAGTPRRTFLLRHRRRLAWGSVLVLLALATATAVDAGAGASTPAPARTVAQSSQPAQAIVRRDRDAAGLIAEAAVRATEFNLTEATDLVRMAAEQGDSNAEVAVHYMRGLVAAREAFLDGGTAEALAPVREAIDALAATAKGRRSSAEIARLVLQAAAAAAQSEHGEMRLYLDTAMQMETLQRAGGLPGAPLVTAAEMAGDLWLQVSRYDEARRAYTEAAERVGSTLRILAGLARSARRLKDVPASCAAYRSLLDSWAARPGLPVEIVEARAYVGEFCPR